jgi:transcriptional regulator with XRE-family HTH domain
MSILAKNIKYLRKKRGWSQETLAGKLDIKRSSIAAYESKNVEPRVSVILAMGKLFNIDIGDLVGKDIQNNPENIDALNGQPPRIIDNQSLKTKIEDLDVLKEFIDATSSTRKMLEGLKVFYKFKQSQSENKLRDYSSDIEGFIMLLEHLLNQNEQLVDFLTYSPEKNH